MTYQAGSAAVSVTPDMSGFHKAIAKELDGLDAQFAKAGDSAGASFSDAFKARTEGLSTTVRADADTAPAEAKLDALTKKPRTVTVRVKEVADKVAGKTGTLKDLLNPVAGGIAAGVALGPQAVGLGAGLAGIGAAFAAAGADAGAFGVIAKGMFSDVTDAQKKLTSAQQAYNTATTDKGRAKALADEKAALAGLSPAEKDLATQLTALTGAWGKLQKAEQPVVGAAIAPWLSTAQSGLRLLNPLIEDGAGAIQLLGTEADKAIKSPFWDQFSGTLGASGQIALTNFGEAAGHAADGVAHLFTAFAPDIDKIPPEVDKIATSFDNWSKSVTDKGLDSFLTKTFTPANMAELAKDGKDVASFAENVAKASNDMSPLAFAGVSNVLTVLGSVPPGVIEAATGLFLAIKTIGTISKGVSAVTGIINGVKGLAGKAGSLLGLGGQEATAAAEGTTVGTTEGESAATAFTTAFQTGVTAGLAESFATIGTEGEAEAATAGTTWGGSAAGAFSVALGGTDALGLAGVFTGIGTEGTAEAAGAGTAWGTAAATAFGASFGTESAVALTAVFAGEDAVGAAEATAGGAALGAAFATGFGGALAAIGTEVAAAIPEAGLVAVLAAGLAGAALGTAFGLGFTLAFAATGAKSVVSGLETDLKNSASNAGTWLQPAGSQAAGGFVTGFNLEKPAVLALGVNLRSWVQSGAAGSNTWIQPHGQQAGQGFATGFGLAHAAVNNAAAQAKNWVSSALPSPLSWLPNTGISVMQGLANGIISGSGAVLAAAQGIANSVMQTINSALQVHSPSKLSFATGAFTGQGLALGLSSTEDMVRASGLSLASASVQGLAGIAAGQSLSALSSLGVPSVSVPRLPGVSSPLGGASGAVPVVLSAAGNDPLLQALVASLQGYVHGAAGGDVQAALGRGPVRIP